jgi:hypothetical protein
MMLPRYRSNVALLALGVLAIVHSLFYFGTGELPEVILALLLFLKGFAREKQSWVLVAIGIMAIGITWIVNLGKILPSPIQVVLSCLGIVMFTALVFSKHFFNS